MAMKLRSKNMTMPSITNNTPRVMSPMPIFWLSSRAMLLSLLFLLLRLLLLLLLLLLN